jgi:hypothetical protein
VELLRRHEVERADARIALERGVRRARDAEVDELGRAGAEHDVGGLHVAMDQSTLVDHAEAGEELAPDPHHIVRWQATARVELLSQRPMPVEQLHDDEVRRPIAPRVVHVDEAGMSQGGRRARLREEAGRELRIVRERRREDLDGHVALEPSVTRPVDTGHPTPRQQAVDAVALRERAPDHRIGVGGRPARQRPRRVAHGSVIPDEIAARSSRIDANATPSR